MNALHGMFSDAGFKNAREGPVKTLQQNLEPGSL